MRLRARVFSFTRSSRAAYAAAALGAATFFGACEQAERGPTDPLAAPATPTAPTRLLVAVAPGFAGVAAGDRHSCAVRTDGTVACWGWYGSGQVAVPAGLTNVTRVTAGMSHSCALKGNGTVTCWGAIVGGLLNPAVPVTGILELSSGRQHVCGRRADGTFTCWGTNNEQQLSVPSGITVVKQVSAGGAHTCAVRTDATVSCWGWNFYGQTNVPPGLTGVSEVSAGFGHNCALRTDGTVTCWGFNGQQQSVPPVGLSGVTTVSSGAYTTCALKTDRSVVCWGYNDDGKLTQPPELTAVTHVNSGTSHRCVRKTGGTIACWGTNDDLQTSAPVLATTTVLPTATFDYPTSVISGAAAALALSGAQVPGHPDATSFTFAFDCGDGAGYAAASSTASRNCPTSTAGSLVVRGRVVDQGGDFTEYSATVTVAAPVSAQSINFTSAVPSPALTGATYVVTATASSGLTVTLSLSAATTSASVCTLSGSASGSTVSFISAGSCTVAADQPGDASFLAAPQATQDITITAANVAPAAAAGGPYAANEGTVLTMNWSAADADDDALAYVWDFGDGVTGAGAALPASHVYTDDGGYTISVTATDPAGSSDTKTATATIANVAPTLGALTTPTAPMALLSSGTVVTLSASLADAGSGDTFTATPGCGGGTGVAESLPAGSAVATATCTFSAAGVYSLKLIVADDDGGNVQTAQQLVVIYDPSAGFVTGHGWIASGAGAYVDGPTFAGRAMFGFVSKYARGASVPSGDTEFEFRAGAFAFSGTTYEWLVVSGARAQYKGAGTVNGAAGYGFLLTATDGQMAGGGGTDKFRMKVWETATGRVVYDNAPGSDDVGASNQTAIGGGSIALKVK